MLFRIAAVCIIAVLAYAGYHIWALKRHHSGLSSPPAAFMVVNEGNQGGLTIVEFLNYGCDSCIKTHRALLEYIGDNPDIRLVVRPVPVMPEEGRIAAEFALAAGLQGKFEEMDKAISEYDALPDEKFFRESAAVYDIDYDKMAADAKGDKVRSYAKDNLAALLALDAQTTPALFVGKTLYQPSEALTLPDIMRIVTAEKTKKQ